jgi:hypothetical protein
MARSVRGGSKKHYWRVVARWRSGGLSVQYYYELHSVSQPSLYSTVCPNSYTYAYQGLMV